MWQDLYVTRKLSLVILAQKLDVSRNTVRSSLERLNIPIRTRGGANNQRLGELTGELIAEIEQHGVAATAKRLGLSYTTLYKRLYKRDATQAEKAEALEQGAVIEEDDVDVNSSLPEDDL